MIIGVDGNEANVNYKVGVHQYAFEILWSLYRQELGAKDKKVRNSYVIYLKNSPQSDLPGENENWKYKILPGGKIWILSRLMPHLLAHPEPKVLFVPSHYVPPIARMPIVCTIHDLGYLESMEQFRKYDFWQLKYWSAISISAAKRVIAVSKATKKDIVRHYRFASNKSVSVLHGYDKTRFNTNISDKDVRRMKRKYKIKKDYILFLSTLKPSKNINGLLEAFSLLSDKLDVELVIAGKKGWMFDSIFLKTKNLHLEKKVIFTDFVSEEDKPTLIYGSKVFTLTPHWEGFGMVALEAMACGTPVVASNVGGLPEVIGKAGVYVDHKDPKDIARGIEKVLTMDESGYNDMVDKGLEQAKKFSWEKAAKETLEVLTAAAKK